MSRIDDAVREAQRQELGRGAPHQTPGWLGHLERAATVAGRIIRDVGFPTVVAAVLLWALLKELPSHLDQVTTQLQKIEAQQDRHNQNLIDLLKERR